MIETQNEEMAAKGICPVCGVKCGLRNPRSAFLAHMKRSADPEHITWRASHWKSKVLAGRRAHNKIEVSFSAEKYVQMIKEKFGDEALDQLRTALTAIEETVE